MYLIECPSTAGLRQRAWDASVTEGTVWYTPTWAAIRSTFEAQRRSLFVRLLVRSV